MNGFEYERDGETKMKHKSIFNKLRNEGFPVYQSYRWAKTYDGEVRIMQYFAFGNGYELSWELSIEDPKEITNLRLRGKNEQSDASTDYYPYFHPSTIKMAIRFLKGDN